MPSHALDGDSLGTILALIVVVSLDFHGVARPHVPSTPPVTRHDDALGSIHDGSGGMMAKVALKNRPLNLLCWITSGAARPSRARMPSIASH